MKKRFFQPIWKFEEIEKQLTALEESGWRLNKIKGLRCFEFVKSKPKTVQYFLTYSITREKLNMDLIENTLVQKFNANQIKGTLVEGLGGTNVFRITKEVELTEQSDNRDMILQHYFFKKVVWGIIFFFLLFAPLAIDAAINIEKFLESLNIFYVVFLSFCFLSIVGYVIYNLVGFIYQNKKFKNK